MAVGTDAGGTWNTTAGNKTVVATPAVNDLIVVIHGISGWASGDDSTITDNNSGGGGTYTKYGTATAPLSTGGGTACALWISVRNSLISSASSTTFTATNTGDTGGGLTVLRFSGMTRTGASAVRQTKGESNATENPPTITFNSTTLTGNPVILACMGEDNPAALTPPTGFTEADDTGWATPTTGVEVCWDDSGNTATLFSWSGGALTDHNEVGIELDTTAASTPNAFRILGARSRPSQPAVIEEPPERKSYWPLFMARAAPAAPPSRQPLWMLYRRPLFIEATEESVARRPAWRFVASPAASRQPLWMLTTPKRITEDAPEPVFYYDYDLLFLRRTPARQPLWTLTKPRPATLEEAVDVTPRQYTMYRQYAPAAPVVAQPWILWYTRQSVPEDDAPEPPRADYSAYFFNRSGPVIPPVLGQEWIIRARRRRGR